MVDSLAEKPIFCDGVWKRSFVGQDGKLCSVSAAMWPSEQVPIFQQAAGETPGVYVTVLAQSGQPIPEPYRGDLNSLDTKDRDWLVVPKHTFVEIVFSGATTPFWKRVAEVKTLPRQ